MNLWNHSRATKEPEEIARWDGQGWEDLGWPYEKFIKGVSIECDTESATKTLELRIDGDDSTAVDTVTANNVGGSIVMHKFNNVLARTVKLVATDDNAGYLYGIKWIWDREPPRITRWETQEHTFESKGYTYLREILVGVRSWDTICLDIWADMGVEVEPSLWVILENASASEKQRGLAAQSLSTRVRITSLLLCHCTAKCT